MKRTIVHMDLDSFFVSCERLKHSELIGKPVVIGGSSNRGVVSACSYEARKFGVRSAMPARYARQLCPDAIFIKGDMDFYAQKSKDINEIITEKAPVVEQASIDEFYLDATGLDKFFGCYQFTSELIQKIDKETGLPMSFGLSINKTVAKMATNYSKPNGRLKIEPASVRPFLDPQSIKKIPMLGDQTFKVLRRIGIKVIKTMREMPMESMEELLGKNGTSLWKKANGIDRTPVVPYTARKSISTERTFDKDTIDIIRLKGLLISMVEKLAFQLRKENKLCSVIAVRIRYSNFDTHTMQCRVVYTANDDILIQKAHELFDKLYERRMLLRLIGVKLSKLTSGNYQIDLFNDTEKMISLYQAMDKMRARYGAKAVHRAVGTKTSKDILPKR